MSGKAAEIKLTEEEQLQLESWIRAETTGQRLVRRARIVLESAAGKMTKDIALSLGLPAAMVSKWRRRFSEKRLWGLFDEPRPGVNHKYDESAEQRLLAMLDNLPPDGQPGWTGELLAKALGDISQYQVWRILRKHSIYLRRQRSWCISIKSEFVPKAVDIVGLYLAPPRNALALCADLKLSTQISRTPQGCLCLYDKQALKTFSSLPHAAEPEEITTLYAALQVAADMLSSGVHSRYAHREFLDFMKETAASWPGREIHVLLNNNTDLTPEEGCWVKHNPNVYIHITPAHVAWLNQVGCWFSILGEISSNGEHGACFVYSIRVRQAIDDFLAAYKPKAAPFEWRKGHCRVD